jgi:hypothetical protein
MTDVKVFLKATIQLQKLNKKMKKDERLREHFNNWLSNRFGTSDNDIVLSKIHEKPVIVFEILKEYNRYKEINK